MSDIPVDNSYYDFCILLLGLRGKIKRHLMKRRNQHHQKSKLAKFQCFKCNEFYSTKGNLKRHLAAIHDGKRFTCQVCFMVYNYEQNLNQHVKMKHPN
jgi:hypothetical protein